MKKVLRNVALPIYPSKSISTSLFFRNFLAMASEAMSGIMRHEFGRRESIRQYNHFLELDYFVENSDNDFLRRVYFPMHDGFGFTC